MSHFTCPHCRREHPTLAGILGCHPRETRALTERAGSQSEVLAVLSGDRPRRRRAESASSAIPEAA